MFNARIKSLTARLEKERKKHMLSVDKPCVVGNG